MKPKAVLAFSGGLDTTYCAVWLREQGYDVHTITVQTGGFDADELAAIEKRARLAGATDHVTVDARQELFDDFLKYLIFANALRGDVYPLCVSVERVVQAKRVALHGVKIGAAALVHGSTGAGNDQVRFDCAFRVFAPQIPTLTPIRAQALSRDAEMAYLSERGVQVPARTGTYSVNRGLWGATIGGAQTHRSDGRLPEDAYLMTAPPGERPAQAEDVAIAFEAGVPCGLDGRAMAPVALIETLNQRAARHGVGRGVHVGDTILGIKGRVAFEAPAAVTLVAAHRDLEKLVLSRHQLFWKRTLGDLYGSFMHESRYFDPLMRDLEAFFVSSQRRVCGEVIVQLLQGQASVVGATSPYSLMDRDIAMYGEKSTLWDGEEAAAFSKIYGMPDMLLERALRKGAGHAAVG